MESNCKTSENLEKTLTPGLYLPYFNWYHFRFLGQCQVVFDLKQKAESTVFIFCLSFVFTEFNNDMIVVQMKIKS